MAPCGTVLDRYDTEPDLAEDVEQLRIRHETLARRAGMTR